MISQFNSNLKRALVCSALTAGIVFFTVALQAQAGDACVSSQAALDAFLKAQPNACAKDADCDGYYLHADSCSPAVVLAKPGVSKARESRLLKLQAQVREVCGKQWSTRAACSPIPFLARCRENRCVDGQVRILSQPVITQAPVGKGNYPYAVIRNSCAPWDGPAVAIYLTKTQVTSNDVPFPYIGISLWRSFPPPLNQPISLQAEQGAGNRCRSSQECESAVAATVTFTSYDDNGAAGTYELKFKNGEVERGSFQGRWQRIRQFCG